MRGPAILVVLLAVSFVGYVVYSQIAEHAPAEEAALEPEGAGPRGRSPDRPDGDGLVVPPDDEDAAAPDRTPDPEARQLRQWMDQLRNSGSSERFDAARELGERGDEAAIPELVRALREDRDFYVRLGAAQALGRIGSWDATDALIVALLDADELVRTAAAESLAGITGHRIPGFKARDRAERRKQWKQEWTRWIAANRPSDK